jgi:diaminopimelate epimerase
VQLAKYHALGNDYLVLAPDGPASGLTPALVRRLCDRHRGVGADGILVAGSATEPFALRIFNPDGSEAEKSGNGLRIFARFLWDQGRVGELPFQVALPGGPVTCHVEAGGSSVAVDMGRVSFDSAAIPVTGPRREVLDEPLEVGGQTLRFSAATIGNPHCVIFRESPCELEARTLGPLIETHPLFPNRTNVQFVRVVSRTRLSLEIWERGAGYTLASGSSSCAAAAVARRLGLCERALTVEMPGGSLEVELGADYGVRQRGAVTAVAGIEVHPEALIGT